MSIAQKTLLLDTQEQKQVMISKRTLEGHQSAAETVRLLNLPIRQIQRMLAASLDVFQYCSHHPISRADYVYNRWTSKMCAR